MLAHSFSLSSIMSKMSKVLFRHPWKNNKKSPEFGISNHVIIRPFLCLMDIDKQDKHLNVIRKRNIFCESDLIAEVFSFYISWCVFSVVGNCWINQERDSIAMNRETITQLAIKNLKEQTSVSLDSDSVFFFWAILLDLKFSSVGDHSDRDKMLLLARELW